MVEPDKVILATDHYRKKNDSYQQFVDECIVMDKKSGINLSELYNRFKDWFKDSFPGQTLPTKSEVREYYNKAWGEPVRATWKGRRLFTVEDEMKNKMDDFNEEELVLNEEDFSN
jgi:phage/plasmid-associated DNA primase